MILLAFCRNVFYDQYMRKGNGQSRFLILSFLFCFGALSVRAGDPAKAGATVSVVPSEYGEVIYQFSPESDSQLFIIGMGHRDALTCLNNDSTAKAQVDAFKIGEWLICSRGLELLFPEGYFYGNSRDQKKSSGRPVNELKRFPAGSTDAKALERVLSDNKTRVNAEMLLRKHYGVMLRQVEDRALYSAVVKGISKLALRGRDSCEPILLIPELDYLQGRRTAEMLQRMPGIVNEEYQRGNISERKALFTIGMSHLHNIIRFLREQRIRIEPPLFGSEKRQEYTGELNLLKEKFGVTVILPRTLANDRELLKMTHLNHLVPPS